MAALLSESGRQSTLVSNTVHPVKLGSVIARGPDVLPESPPALRCESSDVDPENSATTVTSLSNTGASSLENALPVLSTSAADLISGTNSADKIPLNGADKEPDEMQLNSQELDEYLDDEGLRELKTDYERRREERKKEQDLAALERQRLEEIFRICSEYDHKPETPRDSNRSVKDEIRDSASSRSSWGSSSKIKTNGSLTSSGIYSRRSDDVISSSGENYVCDATKQSIGRTEAKGYIINAPKQSNGDSVSHPCITNVAKPFNRVVEPDPIQSPSTDTGPDCKIGKSYARILKLSSEALDFNNRMKPNGFEARLSSKSSDLSDALRLSSTDFSDDIDDDNISTDCFQEESTFSVVSSENSFQTTPPTVNGNRNRYDGNIPYLPADALSKQPEKKNLHWTSSESVLGHQSRENRFQVCMKCYCFLPLTVDYLNFGLKPKFC